MTTTNTDADTYAGLDAEELFYLGVKASREGRDADALRFLKLTVERAPSHAQAQWVLGAEYAGLGMPDRAREHFRAAVHLEPSLDTARFQWGLLELTSGQVGVAQEIWAPLDALAEAHPLRLFKQGMLELARDDMGAALNSLERALKDPALDAALRKDIEMVVQRVRASRNAAQDAPSVADEADDSGVENHLMLSAYQRGLQ